MDKSLPNEVLPAAGAVLIESGDLKEALCKPKLMAIKSSELMKLQKMEARDEKAVVSSSSAAMSGAAAAAAASR